jgi:hypothetical protein
VKAPMAGWISFAAIMMVIVGSLDFFEGLIAIVRGKYYVVSSNQIIVFNLRTWGWLVLFWGIVLVLAGLALASGAGWARWLTVFLAGVNVLGQLSFLGSSSYPLWSLIIISLNIIVIYALTARWEGYSDRVAA